MLSQLLYKTPLIHNVPIRDVVAMREVSTEARELIDATFDVTVAVEEIRSYIILKRKNERYTKIIYDNINTTIKLVDPFQESYSMIVPGDERTQDSIVELEVIETFSDDIRGSNDRIQSKKVICKKTNSNRSYSVYILDRMSDDHYNGTLSFSSGSTSNIDVFSVVGRTIRIRDIVCAVETTTVIHIYSYHGLMTYDKMLKIVISKKNVTRSMRDVLDRIIAKSKIKC